MVRHSSGFIRVSGLIKIMRKRFENSLKDYVAILLRHCFSFVVLIFSTLIALLYLLGESQDATFLASVLFLNIVIGIGQEVRAKRQLDKLKALTVQRLMVIDGNGQTHLRQLEELAVGQTVRLQLGDQVPGDGRAVKVTAFEVNEAFLTGESLPIGKRVREEVFAGSFVTSGSADMMIEALGDDTRLGRLTTKVTRLSFRSTPIQRAISLIITVLSWGLIVIVILLGLRNSTSGFVAVDVLREVAAIAATIVPEGLLLATTLLFAYGAVRLFRSQVLLQRINAIESLGRIQILCLDKTGTLTEDHLELIGLESAPSVKQKDLQHGLGAYLALSDPESEMAQAYIETHGSLPAVRGELVTGFSSERKYGLVKTGTKVLVVGAPDILLKYIPAAQRKWVEEQNTVAAERAERVVLVGEARLQAKSDDIRLISPLGVARFAQPLKPSALKVLRFFQSRGVRPVIISGDQAGTVLAIAEQLGLAEKGSRVITGEEWSQIPKAERQQTVNDISLYARVTPQQKSHIVTNFKRLGFTAMTGDGANDALALKRADVGISMFAAADITRTVADVVLVKNEFSDLPRGVKLADQVITNIELVAGIFLSKVVVGLTLVTWALATSTSYPFSPRMITLLNYFLIGLPILLLALWPRERKRTPFELGFWSQIAPFVITNSVAMILGLSIAYWLSLRSNVDVSMVLFLTTLATGLTTYFCAMWVTGVQSDGKSRLRITSVLVALGLLALGVMIPVVRAIFELSTISYAWLEVGVLTIVIGITLQIVASRVGRRWTQRIRLYDQPSTR